MGKGNSEKIKLAIPKGRFLEWSQRLYEGLGGGTLSPKSLRGENSDNQIAIYFLNVVDIPHLVASGVVDYGIASDEWCLELRHANNHTGGFEVHRTLKWISTKLAFIADRDAEWPPPHGV